MAMNIAYPQMSGGGAGPLGSISLSSIFRTIRRRMWTLVGIVLAVFAAVAYMTFTQTPIYMTSTKVIMDQRQSMLDINAIMERSLSGSMPSDLETELEVIKSPVLLNRVVDKLELYKLPEFNWFLEEPTAVDKLKAQVGSLLTSVTGAPKEEAFDFKKLGEAERDKISKNAAVIRLAGKLKVERIGRSMVVEITSQSEDAKLSADIANAVADQYLVDQLDAKFEQTRRANAWLDERLKKYKKRKKRKRIRRKKKESRKKS